MSPTKIHCKRHGNAAILDHLEACSICLFKSEELFTELLAACKEAAACFGDMRESAVEDWWGDQYDETVTSEEIRQRVRFRLADVIRKCEEWTESKTATVSPTEKA